jgi:anaerobic magnesium-protoporphyrin IX monomethyl ester cyclase
MRFALVNPNWSFEGSTYFGCRDPHTPIELLSTFDRIREGGHEPMLVDAQTDNLAIGDVKKKLDEFDPERTQGMDGRPAGPG